MDQQYRYIIGALIFSLVSLSAALVSGIQAILVLAILANAIGIFLVAEQKRAMAFYKEKLASKRAEQQDLSNLLASEINNMIAECESSLLSINTTQQDAVELISGSFFQMQELMAKQSSLIARSVNQQSLEYVQVKKLTSEIKDFVNHSIRGMQFGDINAQNLQFCLDTLRFIREQIDEIGKEDLDIVINDIRDYLDVVSKRRNDQYNPVSSSNVEAGTVEFF